MKVDEEENRLQGFKAWLRGLTLEELQNALVCDEHDDGDRSGGAAAAACVSSSPPSLLRSMIAQQVPPPLAIHPRVVPKNASATSTGPDGRNEAERVARDRLRRPKYFRLRRQDDGEDGDCGVGARKIRMKRRGQHQQGEFVVIARLFPDVEKIVDERRTYEQMLADEAILTGTVLSSTGSSAAASASSATATRHSLRWSLASLADVPSVLRILCVASRGRFASQDLYPCHSKHNNKRHQQQQHISSGSPLGFAPWLLDQWFSLPMYLASRYELELWNSYAAAVAQKPRRLVDDPCFSAVQMRQWMQLPEATLRPTIRQSLGVAFRETILSHDLAADTKLALARDTRLWSVIVENHCYTKMLRRRVNLVTASYSVENSTSEIQQWLEQLLWCPIVELDTPLYLLRRETCRILQEKLDERVQESLLSELLVEGTTHSQELIDGDNNNDWSHRSSAASKKKRKQRKKKAVGKLKVSDHHRNAPLPAEEKKESPSVSSNEDDVGNDVEACTSSHRYEFPDNDTSSRDRNSNTVYALSIVDTVINRAFDVVGLEPCEGDDDSAEGLGAVGNDSGAVLTIPEDSTYVLPEEAGNKVPEDESFLGVDNDKPAASPAPPVAGRDFPLELLETDRGERLIAPTRSAFDAFAAQYGTLGGGFFHRLEPDGFVWDFSDPSTVADNCFDGSNGPPMFLAREQSLLADMLRSQGQIKSQGNRVLIASSTAASIDSSSENESSEPGNAAGSKDLSCVSEAIESGRPSTPPDNELEAVYDSRSPSPQAPATPSPTLSPILVSLADLKRMQEDAMQGRSPSVPLPTVKSFSSIAATSLPGSPYTHRPQLRPTLSRDDLHKRSISPAAESSKSHQKVSPRSASSQAPSFRVSSLGRTAKSRDDHDIQRRVTSRKSAGALSSYRHSLAKLAKKSVDDHDIRQTRTGFRLPDPFYKSNSAVRVPPRQGWSSAAARMDPITKPPLQMHFDMRLQRSSKQDSCAQSENDLDGRDEFHDWHESRPSQSAEEADNNTVTKDGSTTITSALSQRESEEVSALREERNVYRDMCLTMGAEVAKLKNMLAAQRGTVAAPPLGYSYGYQEPFRETAVFFDHDAMMNQFSAVPRARTLAAMSDAGYRGEHESLASEDDIGGRIPAFAGSDVSLDHGGSSHHIIQFPGNASSRRDIDDPVSLHGMHSRLAREILQFVDMNNMQLRNQERNKHLAIQRFTRLVNAVWPRAQVKLYGSHVTGLCLPSSDVDFVVCLPAVHKNDVAEAPGALEGRNAVNESLQKRLARKLKQESWIDPRSMKVIERTAVPVIKVATKDTRARMLNLDITFDGPGHHGLLALRMVCQILDELPMLRPLVLVLKQFLLDRGLLMAYTGGLSSYCLFLMVARYLQEQPSTGGDCGSLLMGFLDFYGNHVSAHLLVGGRCAPDGSRATETESLFSLSYLCKQFNPRSTGISVRRKEYFARPMYSVARIHQPAAPQTTAAVASTPMWTPPHFRSPVASVDASNFFRRNSFSEKANAFEAMRGGGGPTAGISRPPRYHTASPLPFMAPASTNAPPQPQTTVDNSQDHRIPNTFDPLWVEDPISEGNNVGRNAFRFLQVQRAFSDAHRALVASLEWDMHSTGELLQENHEYPLLKCLLQSEDVVVELSPS